jgi:hypothetical protein
MPQFDYKIVLPQTSKEIKITEIIVEQVRASCPGKVQCINPFISLKIDDKLYYFNDYYYHFFIKK